MQSSCICLIDLDTDASSGVEVKPNLSNPLDGFRIKHSCNGLVLLESMGVLGNVHRCMIYNPVTDSGSDTDMELDLVSVHDTNSEGSDLDIGSEDQAPYSYSLYSKNGAVGEIYSKGCGSWQSLGTLPFSPTTLYNPCHFEKAFFFNFDNYEFGEISGPAHVARDCRIAEKDLALIVVGNRLSIFDAFSECSTISVWVMKEYGVEDSWSREYVIDDAAWTLHNEDDLSPLTCRNNGELVMVSDDQGYILFYDLNKKEGRVVSLPPLELKCRTMI
ncbi:uncharacterized protein LOC143537585 [Bidens hawaiensis]|uniref:uncharacterized protein LOC143537585 n=1 Tax=Bidens hawaiensis TaxID=980011 RepID=UPI00404A2CC6